MRTVPLLMRVFVWTAVLAHMWSGSAADQAILEEGFAHPPPSARPHTWWHWMDGNVTREGITLDLEAMAQAGLGGAQIFDVGLGLPAGPVDYMSDEWRGMVLHAAREAHRLGLELCMHNCAGWSSSGGPWVKPEHAMQMVVVSEARASGPGRFEGQLPQPETRAGFYRDIALLAFPTPPEEAITMADAGPTVTCSDPDLDASALVDGDRGTAIRLNLPRRGPGPWVELTFEEPFTARSVTLIPAWGAGGTPCEVQASEDGQEFRTVVSLAIPGVGLLGKLTPVSFPPTTARRFRLQFGDRQGRGGVVGLAEMVLEGGFRIGGLPGRAGYTRVDDPGPERVGWPVAPILSAESILDITDHMDAEGRVTWDVPPGDWTLLRFGYTPTGKDNHPARESGRGLECDKLSREAVAELFEGGMGKVIRDLGPLAGTALRDVLVDSYEVDCQNWTPRMREEFRARRGYDLLPYLPVLTGRVVDGGEESQRFLWDFRRTIADLYADNYYGYFAELCHRHGMIFSTEPYGNGNFDDLQCGSRADIPMGEFWVGQGLDYSNAKLAASCAHTWGRQFVGAEAFTASDTEGKWQNHPFRIKALGDFMYCGGINRFIFHRYAHQPWRDLRPGMTMGPWGTHFDRTNTWWPVAGAWIQYLSRCQYLLQSGLFVADLCYFTGEGAPNSLPGRGGLRPPPPEGYDYDGCSAEVILQRMAVRDGRIVLPDGMSYRVLVLPPSETMTPELLRKLRELVQAGATVYGPRPSRSPSLANYPDCDDEVEALADEIWGDCDGVTVTEHRLGAGRVIWGEPLAEVLAGMGLPPDFRYRTDRPTPGVFAIHRVVDDTDLYFVSSQSRRTEKVDCTFRVSGKVPELWHPDTGVIERAPVWREEDGCTTVSLRMDPVGSVFVVFRRPAGDVDPVVTVEREGRSILLPPEPARARLEIVRAVYGVLTADVPECVDVTEVLRGQVRNGVLSVVASNSLAGDPAINVVKELWVQYVLDGQPGTATVTEGQPLRIPREGEGGTLEIVRALYGVLPEDPASAGQPRVVDVTEILRGMVQDGRLSVAATNDLAGDPAHLVVKQMRVDYTVDGEPRSVTVWENQRVELPDGSERAGRLVEMPVAELRMGENGSAALLTWEAGRYEARTASGRVLRSEVTDLPAPEPISGPWEVRFPPGLGAPDTARFDELISWPRSSDPGIRYFSGTATYLRDLDIPADWPAPDRRVVLDLGAVREIARVRLNGQDLGIQWKPPFRYDLTEVARPGTNRLEVEVTNLWPNRLIGDEQLPPDAEYVPGGPIRSWPAWLLQGAPRPPTGRVAFTTWQFYNRDSPLLDSGLLGPVLLRLGKVIRLGE